MRFPIAYSLTIVPFELINEGTIQSTSNPDHLPKIRLNVIRHHVGHSSTDFPTKIRIHISPTLSVRYGQSVTISLVSHTK